MFWSLVWWCVIVEVGDLIFVVAAAVMATEAVEMGWNNFLHPCAHQARGFYRVGFCGGGVKLL